MIARQTVREVDILVKDSGLNTQRVGDVGALHDGTMLEDLDAFSPGRGRQSSNQ